MLAPRTETILKSIVGQYVNKATPVASQTLTQECDLRISPATVRHEMAYLEHGGYIIRPHTSAGSIPSDKGYRYYVESLGDVKLPLVEQRLVSHLFHQVERELEEWLNLTATLIARMVQNIAVIVIHNSQAYRFKHLELVSLQDYSALLILVLSGAKVRQQLIIFDRIMSQAELTAIANKLSDAYAGLTGFQVSAKGKGFSAAEQQITDCLVEMIETEDKWRYERRYIEGWHFMLNQPEFAHNQRLLSLMEIVEERSLLGSIILSEPPSDSVRVIIGKENKVEAIRNYSVIIKQYGVPQEATGTICVIGPTRMPYAHNIATVSYLSSVLSQLVAKLYGKEIIAKEN